MTQKNGFVMQFLTQILTDYKSLVTNHLIKALDAALLDRLCGLVVRIPGC
jgi:hypothetical protein